MIADLENNSRGRGLEALLIYCCVWDRAFNFIRRDPLNGDLWCVVGALGYFITNKAKHVTAQDLRIKANEIYGIGQRGQTSVHAKFNKCIVILEAEKLITVKWQKHEGKLSFQDQITPKGELRKKLVQHGLYWLESVFQEVELRPLRALQNHSAKMCDEFLLQVSQKLYDFVAMRFAPHWKEFLGVVDQKGISKIQIQTDAALWFVVAALLIEGKPAVEEKVYAILRRTKLLESPANIGLDRVPNAFNKLSQWRLAKASERTYALPEVVQKMRDSLLDKISAEFAAYISETANMLADASRALPAID